MVSCREATDQVDIWFGMTTHVFQSNHRLNRGTGNFWVGFN